MFKLIFGLVWTAFTIFALVAFTSPAGTSGQSGSGSAWVVLIVFLVIGIFLTLKGLKQVVADIMTKVKGIEIFGVVTDIKETGAHVNNRPELKAKIAAILPDRTVREFYEIIGFNYTKYKLGEVVKLKHYKNDVNILEIMQDSWLSYDDLEIVERIRMQNGCTGQYLGKNGTATYNYEVTNDNYMQGNGYGNDGFYNDGYTTHTVKNVGVHKLDDETVIIDGVEYKKNI